MNKVALHSVPRSGSSWLGEILNSSPETKYCYQPLFSYELKSFLDENSNTKTIQHFFDKLSNTEDDFILQKEARKNNRLPIFKKEQELKFTVGKCIRCILHFIYFHI